VIYRSDIQRSILSLVEQLPAVQVQNKLMACTDRDLALTLEGMSDEDTEKVLGLIAQGKATRVREEMSLQAFRFVEERHRVASASVILRTLRSDRVVRGQRSYLRPRHTQSDT